MSLAMVSARSEARRHVWAQRKALYGPKGHPPETLARLSETTRAQFAAVTHCKWGHEFTAENTARYDGRRRCLACEQRRNRSREPRPTPVHRLSQWTGVPALVPAQLSEGQLRAHKAWVTRRERYGALGFREVPPGSERRAYCRRGHLFTDDNVSIVMTRDGREDRRCRTCIRARVRLRARGDRPAWVTTREGVRISIEAHDESALRTYRALRQAMVAAHPDKGGTPTKFRDAQKRLTRFVADEATWYRRWTVAPPRQIQRASVQIVRVAKTVRESSQ